MTYGDALLWLFELRDKRDPRYSKAAARWFALFVIEAGLPFGEAELVMRALAGIDGANRIVLRRRLVERVRQEGLAMREMPRPGTVRKSA